MAKVVDKAEDAANGAQLRSKVTLHDNEFDEEFTIELVGSLEADPSRDLISISSPLGEALLGKDVGAEIAVEAPGGVHHYKIVHIE
jgi:transcription elongation factor GreA